MNTSARSLRSGLSLRANFSWTFVGNAVYAACQWGMLVILAKVGSPEMVGQFTLGLTVSGPILAFATLKTRLVLATDTEETYRFGDYLGLRILTNLLAIIVVAIVVVLSGYRWETAQIVMAVTSAKVLESISDIFYGLFLQHEHMEYTATSKIIRGPASLLVLGLSVWLTGQLIWGTLALAAAWALVLAGYDIRKGVRLLAVTRQESAAPRWQAATLARLAWLALPLGIVVTLESLKTALPRYFVAQYLGEYALGIFAPIAYLKQVGNLVAIALGMSASPRLARDYAAQRGTAYRALLAKLVAIGAALGLGGILISLLAGRPLLALLYQPEYAREAPLLVWLMAAAGFDYVATFLDYGMTAARYFHPQIPLFLAATGTAALASVFLIPRQGLQGAAYAIVLASFVRLIGSALIVRQVLRTLPLEATT